MTLLASVETIIFFRIIFFVFRLFLFMLRLFLLISDIWQRVIEIDIFLNFNPSLNQQFVKK